LQLLYQRSPKLNLANTKQQLPVAAALLYACFGAVLNHSKVVGLDEPFSAFVASYDIPGTIGVLSNGNNPPLMKFCCI
jgi:hypothetical protein